MTQQCLHHLQSLHGHLAGIHVFASEDDLLGIEITASWGHARILMQGAQLLEWQPENQPAVVWLSSHAALSPGKSPRGGVPICWPWFGPHVEMPHWPAHGFARTSLWDLSACERLPDGAYRLTFHLPQHRFPPDWPHATDVTVSHTLGAAAEIELKTVNRSNSMLTFSEALHSYFGVGDVRQIHIEGLAGCEYIDKANGSSRKRQAGNLALAGETDRVYIGTTSSCVIHDPVLKRRILIEKQNSLSTVVWNPWDDKANQLHDLGAEQAMRMICLESGNVVDNTLQLQPGETHRLSVRYSVL